MNMSKGLFVVLLMAVLSMLMMASFASAAPPKISFLTTIPSNVIAGTTFKISVAASNESVNQFMQVISLVNDKNWPIDPLAVNCGDRVESCIADFTVTVPANAGIGVVTRFTARVTTSTGEDRTVVSDEVKVSGAPSTGVRNQVPVTVEAVEIDNFELSSSSTNVRDLERGSEFDLKVKIKALANANDVEIRAFISGVDAGASNPTSASIRPFDVESGVSYVKSLKLTLPERAAEDTYRIRVVVAGRDNEEIVQSFRIKVTPTDHEVVIRELSISPEETVQAGRAVLATVRVKNIGDSSEGDVKVRVSIPELGVSATPDFIDELKSDDSATSEEFFLRIDPCAKPGTYDVKAEVSFDDGDKVVTARKQVAVTKGPCEASSPAAVATTGGVKIIYSTEPQSLEAGSAAVAYPVVISNDGSVAKTYSFSVAAADWASVRLSPGNVVTVKPGDSQTVYMFVAAGKSAAPGVETLVVRVKDQAGDVVKELAFSANVVGASAAAPGVGVAGLAQLLQLGLVALIVVLVVVGLVVAFRRMKGPKEGEEGTQTYY